MKSFFLSLSSILIILLTISCKQTKESNLSELRGGVFGTKYLIIYDSIVNHQKSIDSIYKAINHSLSTYIPDSDISRINNNEEGILVDTMFLEVFKKAKRIYKETDGYFDPTVGRLVNAYGFGTEKGFKIVSDSLRKKLLLSVGFDKVTIIGNKVEKIIPEITFDVNALAKGYALDVVGRFLESKNIKNYLIEIGGEIRVRGLKNGKPWNIGVARPELDGYDQPLQKTIQLTNKSMATSGNYLKYRVNKKGEKFVHIVNPKTGLAEESNLLSVAVIADGDCADVDAYATAFMVMGLDETKQFIKKHKHLKVILMYLDDKNKFQIFEN